MSDEPDNVIPFSPEESFETAAATPSPISQKFGDVTITMQAAAAPASPAASTGVGAGEKMPSRPSAAAGDDLPPDPAEAFSSKPGLQEYYYEEAAQRFWLKNAAARWCDLSETGLKRQLKKEGLRDKPNPGKVISPIDEKIRVVEQDFRVAYAGLLAGSKAGVHWNAGRRVLVSEDPVLIEPVKGLWPVLEKFFEGLLVGREPADDAGKFIEIDQRPHFFAWLQHVVQCFRDGRTDTGLALCMAGEPNSGKTFLALIIRWILGGRVARPYDAMIGKDHFNRDIVEAVLQLVDDDNQADTRLEARLKFAGELKKIVANSEVRLRSMHKDGFTVEVLRRLVVLVNLQLSRLMVLPPLDGDVNDKILLLKGYSRPPPAEAITTETPAELACWPAPMPTRTAKEKEEYRAAVRAELPAFLFWLLQEFKMPSQVSGGRFVVRHWHHPALVSALQDLSPHMRIWELILRSQCVLQEWRGQGENEAGLLAWRTEWTGSASNLEQLLKGESSKLTLDEKREIPQPNWLGQRLQSCADHFGPEVCRLEVSRTKKTWVLKPRKEDRER